MFQFTTLLRLENVKIIWFPSVLVIFVTFLIWSFRHSLLWGLVPCHKNLTVQSTSTEDSLVSRSDFYTKSDSLRFHDDYMYCDSRQYNWLLGTSPAAEGVVSNDVFDLFNKLNLEFFRVQLGRVCRKIFFVTGALQHFMNNNMSFNNTRCISLDKDLHPEEYLDFRQDSPVHKFDYLLSSAVNARFYLMKDDPSTIPAAKRNIIFLFIIHYALLAVVCGSVLYLSVGYLRNTTLYNELWK